MPSFFTQQSSKHKQYADYQIGLNCRQSLCFGDVDGDGVEDVDQD